MARKYANIATLIWRNEDFVARTIAAQHLYLLLATQADISAAGVLSLNVRRWSARSTDATPASIVAALRELEAARFVIYDNDTEELLVRSFVRWDGGHTNPKRRPVIIRAATEVESPKIRRALGAEFARLGLPVDGLADSLSASQSGSPSHSQPDAGVDPLSTSDSETVDNGFPQADSLSDSVSPSEGVVVTKGPSVPTSTLNPQTVPPSAGSADTATTQPARRTRRQRSPANGESADPTAQAVVAAFVDGAKERNRHVTRQVLKQVGATAKRLLEEPGLTPDELINAAKEMGRLGWKDLNMQLLRGSNGGGHGSGSQPSGRLRDSHANQERYLKPIRTGGSDQ